jgi:predicted RNA-binding protein
MNMQERDNILRILRETKHAVEEGNPTAIRNLSNQTMNTAALSQDPDNIAVAVIVYSLSKILEREDYKNLEGWEVFYKLFTSALDRAIKDIEIKDDEKFRKDFEMIRKAINKISGKLRKYIEEVFRQASINKASRIYEHGLSMEQTANLLGIGLYELAEYVGKTGISEVPQGKTMDVRDRIKIAMEIFE